MTALIVIAKAPVPGRVKTRLTPPCTPEQAAAIAEAALTDSLVAVRSTPATRYVCVLDGEPGSWLPDDFEVLPQRGDGLDERLASAFEDVGTPALLVGMDTPQLTPALLHEAVIRLDAADAVIGMAQDGGYWAIGLQASSRELFEGVAMSADDTGQLQLQRLREHGLDVAELPTLLDVDTADDALEVAALAPGSRFAAAVEASLGARA